MTSKTTASSILVEELSSVLARFKRCVCVTLSPRRIDSIRDIVSTNPQMRLHTVTLQRDGSYLETDLDEDLEADIVIIHGLHYSPCLACFTISVHMH